MGNENQLLFVHALIILPDNRVLLRKLCSQKRNVGKWTATIEEGISIKDNPLSIVTKSIGTDLDINLSKVSITSINSINIQNYNRKIFPFVIHIKQMITLKSSIDYQFSIKPFSTLSLDILTNTTNYHKLSEIAYTLNTISVIKEIQANDYVQIKR